jgi:hypothetical protein
MCAKIGEQKTRKGAFLFTPQSSYTKSWHHA